MENPAQEDLPHSDTPPAGSIPMALVMMSVVALASFIFWKQVARA